MNTEGERRRLERDDYMSVEVQTGSRITMLIWQTAARVATDDRAVLSFWRCWL